MTEYEKLFKKYGYCFGLCGRNEDGENVIVTIGVKSATVVTSQHNGFIRTNVYYKDGTSEELFDH